MSFRHFTDKDLQLIEQEWQELKALAEPRCRTAEEFEIVRKAFDFANTSHVNVRRRSGTPYIIHPIEVAKIVVGEIGLGYKSITAALLHDVVEDSSYTIDDIRNLFGDKIASLVDGLNKIKTVLDNDSRNNIYPMKATYNADHTIVNGVEGAIYTVETYEGGVAFMDCYGYYLVASGGNPNRGNNNYLTTWDNYISPSYGNYGVWDVTVHDDMTMTVKSRGNSRSNVIMYNPNKQAGHDIYACYADTASYTRVSVYRRNTGVIPGDANCDGVVDVADITAIASFILGATPDAWNRENADANRDGSIDVADITATAAIILNK